MKTITLSTDFFNLDEIQAIGAEFGPLAELLAMRLLLDIHRNGYYLQWNRLTRLRITRAIPGLTEAQADAIVKRLAEYGFFDRKILQNHSVLTSKEIQTRFFKANRKGIEKPQYLLVDPTPPAPVRRTHTPADKPANGHQADSAGRTCGSMPSAPDGRRHDAATYASYGGRSNGGAPPYTTHPDGKNRRGTISN